MVQEVRIDDSGGAGQVIRRLIFSIALAQCTTEISFLIQISKDTMSTCTNAKTNRQSSQTGRFVAVDRTAKQRIVASGTTAKITIKRAEQTGKNYTMAYVPPSGKKYIF
jgi:3-hydroxymyristoyl/3-hydroxydecanoyl-(acyl carrier protein) dehydratase